MKYSSMRISVTDESILMASEDANVILLNGDLPRHDGEPVWDYHARVRDEIQRRISDGLAAAIEATLAAEVPRD